MLENLTDKLHKVVHYIKGYGKLTEDNVSNAVRQIKLALLESDVNYNVVKHFVQEVKEKSLDTKVLSSITPSKVFFKIVYDEILQLLDSGNGVPVIKQNKRNVIVLFGANGSGKTTTSIKLAQHYKKYNPIIVAADLIRPAAIEQLKVLTKQNQIELFADLNENNPMALVKRALKENQDDRLVIVDTAGRFDTDMSLMSELQKIVTVAQPDYKVLVIDSNDGQKGIELIQSLNQTIGIDNVILSKMDSDAKGGLVLSLKYTTHIPVSFVTTGEKPSDFAMYDSKTFADRIMNLFTPDVNLVSELQEHMNEEVQEEIDLKEFNFMHFLKSLKMLEKGNILSSLMKSVPGLDSGVSLDKKELGKFKAIIFSMTGYERTHPGLIDYKRRLRISAGSGTTVKDVNILIKRFSMMKKMMKKFKNNKSALNQMMSKFKGGKSLVS